MEHFSKDRSDVVCEQNEWVKDDSKVFGRNNLKAGLAMPWNEEDWVGASLLEAGHWEEEY